MEGKLPNKGSNSFRKGPGVLQNERFRPLPKGGPGKQDQDKYNKGDNSQVPMKKHPYQYSEVAALLEQETRPLDYVAGPEKGQEKS